MEIWDGYTMDKELAGVDLIREEEFARQSLANGLYHLVADVVVRHKDGTWLVMQRSFDLPGHPGEWQVGACGSVLKGETGYKGALRELREETGIRARKLVKVNELSSVHINGLGVHYEVYYYRTNMDKQSVKLCEGETIAFRWVTTDEVLNGEYIRDRKWQVVRHCRYEDIVW